MQTELLEQHLIQNIFIRKNYIFLMKLIRKEAYI